MYTAEIERMKTRQAARRRRRIFQAVMRGLCGLCLLLLLGAVGGMEQDSMALGRGFLISMAALGGFGLTAWLGGMMR